MKDDLVLHRTLLALQYKHMYEFDEPFDRLSESFFQHPSCQLNCCQNQSAVFRDTLSTHICLLSCALFLTRSRPSSCPCTCSLFFSVMSAGKQSGALSARTGTLDLSFKMVLKSCTEVERDSPRVIYSRNGLA